MYDKSYIIYVDKFYTSIDLALSLLSNTTYLCGSFQIGRKKWPNDLKPNKQLKMKDDPVRSLERGQSLARQTMCRKLNACVWKDMILVSNLSTCYKPSCNERKDMYKERQGTSQPENG